MNDSTLCICVGADVHLDEIVLCVVDKADGHEVIERFRVTNNLPGAQAAATAIAETRHTFGLHPHRDRLGSDRDAVDPLPPLPEHLPPACSPLSWSWSASIPKLVTKFKDGLVLRSPKNDERDAFDVAARLRFGELPLSYVPGDFWQGLAPADPLSLSLSRKPCLARRCASSPMPFSSAVIGSGSSPSPTSLAPPALPCSPSSPSPSSRR